MLRKQKASSTKQIRKTKMNSPKYTDNEVEKELKKYFKTTKLSKYLKNNSNRHVAVELLFYNARIISEGDEKYLEEYLKLKNESSKKTTPYKHHSPEALRNLVKNYLEGNLSRREYENHVDEFIYKAIRVLGKKDYFLCCKSHTRESMNAKPIIDTKDNKGVKEFDIEEKYKLEAKEIIKKTFGKQITINYTNDHYKEVCVKFNHLFGHLEDLIEATDDIDEFSEVLENIYLDPINLTTNMLIAAYDYIITANGNTTKTTKNIHPVKNDYENKLLNQVCALVKEAKNIGYEFPQNIYLLNHPALKNTAKEVEKEFGDRGIIN